MPASSIDLGNVLVVGGSGFVGSHCIRDVLREGASGVHALNSRIPPAEHQIPAVQYHAADLGDAAAIERAVRLAAPTVVIHTASPRPFADWPANYNRVNIQARAACFPRATALVRRRSLSTVRASLLSTMVFRIWSTQTKVGQFCSRRSRQSLTGIARPSPNRSFSSTIARMLSRC